MKFESETERWSRLARALHWGMALLISVEMPAGLIMGRTYAARDPVQATWHWWTANIHHSLGLRLLALLWLRVGEACSGRSRSRSAVDWSDARPGRRICCFTR